MLAAKCALSVRVDALGEQIDPAIGLEGRQTVRGSSASRKLPPGGARPGFCLFCCDEGAACVCTLAHELRRQERPTLNLYFFFFDEHAACVQEDRVHAPFSMM